MKIIPLFGTSMKGYSPVVSSQRRLNCLFDIRQDQDKAQIVIRGTPGTTLFATLPTAPIRGWRVVGSLLYVVAGAVLYSVSYGGVINGLGTLNTTTGLVQLADNGVQIGLVDGVNGYIYTLVTGSYNQSALNAAGSFGQITADANFPNGATSIDFINGRFLVNKPNTRQCYVCEAYDGTLWTNTTGTPTLFSKENTSDYLVKVSVLNGTVVLWGLQSIEFWQDVGNYPLPYQRISGSSQTWGLAATTSVALLNNTAVFLGQNPQGGVQVMMLNGYAPQRISNSDVEHLISSFSLWSDAIALTYIVDGHPIYQLTFPTGRRTLIYDSLTGLWSEAQTGIALTGSHFGLLGIAFNGQNYISDTSSGNIYLINQNAYSDNGATIKRQVTTRHIHSQGNLVSIPELWLDLETGVGLQVGQGSNPQIMLRVSKDGGRTWGAERWTTIGQVGQYRSPRAIWRRLGMARDFVFEFTMTDPVKFTIIAGSAKIVQGSDAQEG